MLWYKISLFGADALGTETGSLQYLLHPDEGFQLWNRKSHVTWHLTSCVTVPQQLLRHSLATSAEQLEALFQQPFIINPVWNTIVQLHRMFVNLCNEPF